MSMQSAIHGNYKCHHDIPTLRDFHAGAWTLHLVKIIQDILNRKLYTHLVQRLRRECFVPRPR